MPNLTIASASNPETALLRLENITKRFPGVVANQNVQLNVRNSAFHAVIGENGAGKSTLLNILYGRMRPDAGRLWIRGEEVTNALHSPADAIRRGVGLVSQHNTLIPALSVLENVMLGQETTTRFGGLNRRDAARRITASSDALGLAALDLNARAERLSVAAQQKVEILKALYRGAQILLLDEPTATLAPPEADALYSLLHTLNAQGVTIVFVTHKLREVMAHSDAVTVLRAGRNAGDFLTNQTDEQELLLRMLGPKRKAGGAAWGSEGVGEETPRLRESSPSLPLLSPLLQVEDVTARNARGAVGLQSARLEVGVGEIVGVAGVDGSGQRELAEAIVGLRRLERGRIFLAGQELTRETPRRRQRLGIAYIPEDRHREGLILDFSVAENYLLGHETERAWGGGITLAPAGIAARAANMVQRYDVRLGNRDAAARARSLSGGNQQKIVIARAMESGPRLLVACQPTRGLDVEAARFVYETLRRARAQGLGVLLISLDLEEIFALSDRIAVLFDGRIVGVLPRSEATLESVGALMTGAGAGL